MDCGSDFRFSSALVKYCSRTEYGSRTIEAHQLTFLIQCPYHCILYRRLIKPCPDDKLNPTFNFFWWMVWRRWNVDHNILWNVFTSGIWDWQWTTRKFHSISQTSQGIVVRGVERVNCLYRVVYSYLLIFLIYLRITCITFINLNSINLPIIMKYKYYNLN